MKVWRAVLALLLLASVCAACGGGKSPSPSPSLYGRPVGAP
jgi:ABC-type glycerol-3-phosphate transport system substrate-binding protein